MNAREIVTARKGKWCGGYGLTACPICQPEMRNDQMSLSIADKCNRLLMKCHKGNCAYVSILRALGVSTNKPKPISEKDALRLKAEAVREAMRGQARALKIWRKTEPRRHLYLARKGFPQLQAATISIAELKSAIKIPRPLKNLEEKNLLLVVPMRNSLSELQSLEFITSNGEKCLCRAES